MDRLYILEQEALARMGGNKKLYVKLLKSFLGNDSSYQNLIASFAAGDLETAQHEAHTIKGVAGNLALHILYDESERLGISLKSGAADAEILDSFKNAMEKTAEAVSRYIEDTD